MVSEDSSLPHPLKTDVTMANKLLNNKILTEYFNDLFPD